MSVIVVTGTDTDVGKTIATAAIAAVESAAGMSVVVYKPTQTGVTGDEPGDVAVVERLTGVRGEDGVRLSAAMAPRPAAALEAAALPRLQDHIGRIRELEASYNLVLVEGAGGLLVELTAAGESIADLAHELAAPVVVVARSALGTLNHTALTLEALSHRGVRGTGVLIGSWPAQPSFVEVSNREAFAAGAVPLLGAIPAGAGALSRAEFCARAPAWLAESQGLSAAVPSLRSMANAEELVRELCARIDAHSWDTLAELLHPDFVCRYVHTGEVLRADDWVRLNAEYPGFERLELLDLVVSGDRAVARARIVGGSHGSTEEFQVASFITERDGLIGELTEVWADVGAEPPEGTRLH